MERRSNSKEVFADLNELNAIVDPEDGDLWIVEDDSTGTAGNGYVWNETDGTWDNVGQIQGPQGPAGPITSLGKLTNVDDSVDSADDGHVLTWDTDKWVAKEATGGGGASTLGELTNVDTGADSAADGNVLTWDSNQWKAVAPEDGSALYHPKNGAFDEELNTSALSTGADADNNIQLSNFGLVGYLDSNMTIIIDRSTGNAVFIGEVSATTLKGDGSQITNLPTDQTRMPLDLTTLPTLS